MESADFAAVCEPQRADPLVLPHQFRHIGPETDFAAKAPVLSQQEFQKPLNPAGRPEQPLGKHGPEHDNKLGKRHVVLFRIAIQHEQQKKHIGKSRFRRKGPELLRLNSPAEDFMRVLRREIGHNLTSQGFYEAINYSFVSPAHPDMLELRDRKSVV